VKFGIMGWRGGALLWALTAVLCAQSNSPQGDSYQREFPQSKADVEKVLKQLLPSSAGHLPVLDGFTVPGERSLDLYQRGYYQCTAHVSAAASGGTLIRVSAKITAWYADRDPAKSGYQVLPSNGRLENDFLDRLQDALAANSSPAPVTVSKPAATATSTPSRSAKSAGSSQPTISAPMPGGSVLSDAIASTKTSAATAPPSIDAPSPVGSAAVASPRSKETVADKHMEELTKEAKGLEEILHNQSHPNNLVAVKQSDTPVLAAPNEGAKVLFLASAEDEFEILDLNASWVHVRISGLSRGWIRRSNLEMPEAFAAPANSPVAVSAPADAKPSPDNKPFQVESQETASFPGDWPPLRGKVVAIISVQKTNPNATDADNKTKLELAKTLFDQKYNELSRSSTNTEGVVLIFDSADGGMVAATLPNLQQWKAGTLSDEAFWRRCYFDPPEMFHASGQ
jgi:hypothetical protein